MSLISRIGRRFREKPKSSNLDLPSLPTPREILEDIESCSDKDPTISFAYLIQKKGRQCLLDSDFLEGSSSMNESHLAFLQPYQTTVEESSVGGLEEQQIHAKSNVQKRRGSITSPQPSGNTVGKRDVEQLNSYNKLKQFLLLYEKSEELLENIEPYFKNIELTLQACEAYSNSEDKCQEFETDVCASPLM